MLTQLEGRIAALPQWVYVAVSAGFLLIIFALRLRDRRRQREPKLVLENEGGKKGIRFITRHKREKDPKRRRTVIGFAGMALVVVAGFSLSANTSIIFADVRLHMEHPWTLTIGLVLEAIVLGLTVYSWAFEDKGTARAAYLLVFAQAIGAIEVVRFQHEDIGTAAVRIVGPVMLAYGLHKLLGLETKLRKIEIKSNGMLARFWRDRLQRLESKLGIGSRGADAEEITRRNAENELIRLSTIGRPWYLVGAWGKGRFDKRLMKAGDTAFKGLDAFDQLAAEERVTTRIDRAGAFKRLPNRDEPYELRSVRPAHGPQGAPQGPGGFGAPLTSEGAAGRTLGPTPGAPEAHPGEAQAQSGHGGGEQQATPPPAPSPAEQISRAFDVYCELRDKLPAGSKPPSQNSFETEWRARNYGLSTDDVRALYKEILKKMTHPKATP
jgi:hypothetical protein